MIQLGVCGITDWSWCFVCRNFMVITLLWIHICFPSIFWVAARYGKKEGFVLFLFIRWKLIPVSNWTCKKNSSMFYECMFLTKGPVGSCPTIQNNSRTDSSPFISEEMSDDSLSAFIRSSKDLRNVLRYGILYPQFQNIKTIHFLIIFQKLKEYFIWNQGDDMLGLL